MAALRPLQGPLPVTERALAHVETVRVETNRVLPAARPWEADGVTAPVAKLRTREPSRPQRASWRPSDEQMAALVERLRAVISLRDPSLLSLAGPGVHGLDVSDVDLTLIDTILRMPLLDAENAPVCYPGTPTPVVLGAGPHRNQEEELAALLAAHPQLEEKAGLHFDRSALTDGNVLRRTPAIEPTMHALGESAAKPERRAFILTARSGKSVMDAIKDVLGAHAVPVTDVLGSGVGEGDPLGLSALGLDAARRKAVVLSALARLYGPKLGQVRFVDDNPDFLRAAMELLPGEHPETSFQFWGVRRRPSGEYRMWPVIDYRGDVGAFFKPYGDTALDAAGRERQLTRYQAHSAPAADLNPRP